MSVYKLKTNHDHHLFEIHLYKPRNIEIDVLVNNAGFGVQGEHVDLDINKIQEMIQLNIGTVAV